MERKLTVLARIAKALNGCSATWAVGASAMLYLNGIADHFHDIDIMVSEEDIGRAEKAMSLLGKLQPYKPNPQYQTKYFREYIIDDTEVDMIAGFVIVRNGIAYPAPFDETHIEKVVSLNGIQIPLQKLSDWQYYYALMGRPDKARMCMKIE